MSKALSKKPNTASLASLDSNTKSLKKAKQLINAAKNSRNDDVPPSMNQGKLTEKANDRSGSGVRSKMNNRVGSIGSLSKAGIKSSIAGTINGTEAKLSEAR